MCLRTMASKVKYSSLVTSEHECDLNSCLLLLNTILLWLAKEYSEYLITNMHNNKDHTQHIIG
jgi:hypothetical protein